MDKIKLIKCLELTRSSNNNEILSAIKKANLMVDNWEDIISKKKEPNNDNSFFNDIQLKYNQSEVAYFKQQSKDLKTIIYILSVIIIIILFLLGYKLWN